MARVIIRPEAKNKIAQTAMDICKEYAKEVEEEMDAFFREEISNFYNDPRYRNRPPRQYVRHHEKGYPEPGLNKTYEKVFKEHENSYEGGIRISTDEMYTTGYRGSTEQVLDSFLKGYHGPETLLKNPRKTVEDIYRGSEVATQLQTPTIQPLEESRKHLKELVDDIDKRIKEGGV